MYPEHISDPETPVDVFTHLTRSGHLVVANNIMAYQVMRSFKKGGIGSSHPELPTEGRLLVTTGCPNLVSCTGHQREPPGRWYALDALPIAYKTRFRGRGRAQGASAPPIKK